METENEVLFPLVIASRGCPSVLCLSEAQRSQVLALLSFCAARMGILANSWKPSRRKISRAGTGNADNARWLSMRSGLPSVYVFPCQKIVPCPEARRLRYQSADSPYINAMTKPPSIGSTTMGVRYDVPLRRPVCSSIARGVRADRANLGIRGLRRCL